jgi:hypothetical protein
VIWSIAVSERPRGHRSAAVAAAVYSHPDNLDVDVADQASKSPDMGIQ